LTSHNVPFLPPEVNTIITTEDNIFVRCLIKIVVVDTIHSALFFIDKPVYI